MLKDAGGTLPLAEPANGGLAAGQQPADYRVHAAEAGEAGAGPSSGGAAAAGASPTAGAAAAATGVGRQGQPHPNSMKEAEEGSLPER